jgi:hypothetical protein
MKRWGIALLAVLLACLPILLSHSTSADLLADTDTAVLLRTIRERDNALSWFTGDWPLQNHFYRPISTLAFELDNRLYGTNAAGYGWTNAMLCVLCVVLLFWFLMELTESPLLSGACSVLFALWHMGYPLLVTPLLPWIAGVIAVLGLWRHGFNVQRFLPAVLVLLYLGGELDGVGQFGGSTVFWLPGRTATVMTVFALMAMAAYARYERLSARRDPAEPTAMDQPATRSSAQRSRTARWPIGWALLSVLCAALAFGSYEQAIMLPAALFGVAVTFRLRRYRVRWAWQAAFWVVLFGYLFLRARLLPSEPSRYQLQQFRNGVGVYYALLDYLLPGVRSLPVLWQSLSDGPIILLTAQPWLIALDFVSNVVAYYQARREWIWALTGWALSVVTFLPMAWLNPFGHYHYWPMAMRSLFVVALMLVAAKLCVIAVSPPALQAPRRPSPAPGSLPRR